jgi:cell division protein FtsQ
MATLNRTERKPRRAPSAAELQEGLPIDVRLMNAAAGLLAVIALASVAWAAWSWATRWPGFTLREIRIEGDVGHASAAAIRANAMPQLAGNFFSIDLASARRAFETVPWVRRAAVRRVWPDQLVVRLEEHRAAAWWQGDESDASGERGDERLVNDQGEVFEVNPGDVEDENLPVLRGPDGTAAAALAMQRRLAPEIQALGTAIDTLALSSRGSWSVRLATGARIELGRGDEAQVGERTRIFVATAGTLVARYGRPIAAADLRHADGYALRLRGVTTGEPVPGRP